MKKLVLILSATFSSISAFANEDFASNEAYSNEFAANNELANDEIIAQTFAAGANNEIAALSIEEMQNTKGASSLPDLSAGLNVMATNMVGSMGVHAHIHKVEGRPITLGSMGMAALTGAVGGSPAAGLATVGIRGFIPNAFAYMHAYHANTEMMDRYYGNN